MPCLPPGRLGGDSLLGLMDQMLLSVRPCLCQLRAFVLFSQRKHSDHLPQNVTSHMHTPDSPGATHLDRLKAGTQCRPPSTLKGHDTVLPAASCLPSRCPSPPLITTGRTSALAPGSKLKLTPVSLVLLGPSLFLNILFFLHTFPGMT